MNIRPARQLWLPFFKLEGELFAAEPDTANPVEEALNLFNQPNRRGT